MYEFIAGFLFACCIIALLLIIDCFGGNLNIQKNIFYNTDGSEGFSVDVSGGDEEFVSGTVGDPVLDELVKRAKRLGDYIEKKYPDCPRVQMFDRRSMKTLLRKHKPTAWNKDVAYTVAKGKSINICLDMNNINTLTFVLIHEMAHIMTPYFDNHSKEVFWPTFKFMLKEAVEAGVYTPVDYSANPVQYCGMRIYHNPLFDNSIGTFVPAKSS